MASSQWASATDAIDAHTLEVLAAEVSTRRYRQTLDPLPEAMNEHCISRSAASCRLVALSSKRMHELLSRTVFVRNMDPRRRCFGWEPRQTRHRA